MPTVTETRTKTADRAAGVVEFSVRPWTTIDLDTEDDGETMSALLEALIADPVALGPVVGYEIPERRLYALFQVELRPVADRLHVAASSVALEAFDRALAAAGVDERAEGLALVEGGPDDLP